MATFGLALALTPGLAACARDGPDRTADRAAVVAKIRSDPQMEGTPDGVVNCLADWYMASASAESRTAFVEGRQPPQNDDVAREAAVLECLKGAA
ncbi:hypothetical protein Ari01nite_74720 [Paractinoplanes rishiriensis]|uniref:Uncharacterized protein n=2 Tax=Paractinoplanes rishiriensis TaxID=1050105 RepID=A0A919K622_9ACTN|nr:hypothetical protein Ari01nite_74720 [Actinoplanes rishiriensis]